MQLSICIVTHNHENTIFQCINSIYLNINIKDYEIIIIDDNSTDQTINKISKFSEKENLKVFSNDRSKSLSYNNNFAAKKSSGTFLLFLNPDIIFTEETDIAAMLNYISKHPDVGSLSCLLKYENGKIQESFRRFQTFSDFFLRGLFGKVNQKYYNSFSPLIRIKQPFEVDWLLGAFLILERKFFFEIGGFDLRYRLYYEDVDLGYKIIKNGKKNVVYPACSAIHKYHRSSALAVLNKYKFFHIISFFKFKLKMLLGQF